MTTPAINSKYQHHFSNNYLANMQKVRIFADNLTLIPIKASMEIHVYRGNQIGGCITTIEHEGCKIMIDLGSNLPGSKVEDLTEEQVCELTRGVDAIFYTHFHGDHVGMYHLVPPQIPQYIAEGAKEVMLCKYEVLCKHGDYSQQLEAGRKMIPYKENVMIDVGGKGKIFVTPYFVSHSAFNAYMFNIVCDGIRILHTGDFRRNGYLGKSLYRMLKFYVKSTDILIIEGTMLKRRTEPSLHENVIKINARKALKKHKYMYALCSSTDIDRLASFHKACKEAERNLVIDSYQNSLFDIFTKHAGQKSDLYCFNNVFRLIHMNEKIEKKFRNEGFLMLIRANQHMLNRLKEMLNMFQDEPSWLIYSMWNGYAETDKEYTNEDVIAIRELFEGRVYDGVKDGFHTSGHADTETLENVCTMLNPRMAIIPIHKEQNSDFSSLNIPDELKKRIRTQSCTFDKCVINIHN